MAEATKNRVLLTGAFGNIGRETIAALLSEGAEVFALDLGTPQNRKSQAKWHRKFQFDTLWVDVSDDAAVVEAVARIAPSHIIHLASIIPPHVYVDHCRSERVNVHGTENLIRAAEQLPSKPHFIFASSHTVHGQRNGARNLPLLAADTPRQATDLYTDNKLRCEDLLFASTLPWTILRYGIIFPQLSLRMDEDALRLSFIVPLESRSHPMHVKDAGLATARSIRAVTKGKILMIGGGENWKQRQRYFLEKIMAAVGIGMLPDSAYFEPDPECDESWYYNDWMDTEESQALLDYQQRDPEDYFAEVRSELGVLRYFSGLLAPVLRRKMVRLSPFHRGGVDPQAAASTLAERLARFATPGSF